MQDKMCPPNSEVPLLYSNAMSGEEGYISYLQNHGVELPW